MFLCATRALPNRVFLLLARQKPYRRYRRFRNPTGATSVFGTLPALLALPTLLEPYRRYCNVRSGCVQLRVFKSML